MNSNFLVDESQQDESKRDVKDDHSERCESLLERFLRIRERSERIAAPLSAEDCAMQTMPDVSPTRWHLAHTTWFFETFLLKEQSEFNPFNSAFESLFNSYYNALGRPFPRDRRGQISRPNLDETMHYRGHVDHAIVSLLRSGRMNADQLRVLELGLHHEQQHQELMLTDIKHVLFSNPLLPAYQGSQDLAVGSAQPRLEWAEINESITLIGHHGSGFAYDNELPRHRSLVHPHRIASRPTTVAEYLEFVSVGGYQQPQHWLSLGWDFIQRFDIQSPLYWMRHDDQWQLFTLSGLRPLRLEDPVCHVSYFEADAFARWSGKRLPTEFEWEHSAGCNPAGQNFVDAFLGSDRGIHPRPPSNGEFLGNVWEWTSSHYSPYPGYRAADGAIGEYNGKFMCNQFVLRGGSCATSADHIRRTYRNFFPPETRWQFSGIRLAESK